MISRLEIEEMPAVGRFLLFVAGIVGAVALHRRDAVQRRVLRLVEFTRQNGLGVPGLQHKPETVVGAPVQLEPATHGTVLSLPALSSPFQPGNDSSKPDPRLS